MLLLKVLQGMLQIPSPCSLLLLCLLALGAVCTGDRSTLGCWFIQQGQASHIMLLGSKGGLMLQQGGPQCLHQMLSCFIQCIHNPPDSCQCRPFV